MTPERFSALLDAYGADPKRWPETERAAALAMAARASAEQRTQIQAAAQLDAYIARHDVAAPDAALARGIAATAFVSSAKRHGAAWWWPRAGLVGAGLAGALTGAFAVSVALRFGPVPTAVEWPERSTSFTELSADWSEE